MPRKPYSVVVAPGHPTGFYRRGGFDFFRKVPVEVPVTEASDEILSDPNLVVTNSKGTRVFLETVPDDEDDEEEPDPSKPEAPTQNTLPPEVKAPESTAQGKGTPTPSAGPTDVEGNVKKS